MALANALAADSRRLLLPRDKGQIARAEIGVQPLLIDGGVSSFSRSSASLAA